MQKIRGKYSKKKLKISIALVLIGFLYYIEIMTVGLAIPCYFHLLTGLECPGCGVTGVAMSILKWDWDLAYRCNRGLFLISPVLLPLLGIVWYRWITDRSNNLKAINICGIFCVAFLVVWAVFRNIYGY